MNPTYQPCGLPLRVHHYPQVPCKPFVVNVKDEEQAALIIKTLAQQHLWLYENKFIPDYANAICVVMKEDGEWVDYYNHKEEMEWDEFESTYFTPENTKK